MYQLTISARRRPSALRSQSIMEHSKPTAIRAVKSDSWISPTHITIKPSADDEIERAVYTTSDRKRANTERDQAICDRQEKESF
ncbi:hypothetical protein AC578_4237 [Pseudocercospora eumusae]|uniref:Uncharacterized protein n=1 Tax=Pseudocercospora eumusae TaxID=321146 RepID=A0A139H3I2_9PEZI|nr:hypothetical protein AC578_4237 [Pseudocercospora eumusae]